MIEINEVTKKYADFTAVNNLMLAQSPQYYKGLPVYTVDHTTSVV